MKRTITMAVLLGLCVALSACASNEELMQEALQTGDWSAYDARMRTIARVERRKPFECPKGLESFCEIQGGRSRCNCVDSHSKREMFEALTTYSD